jgi:hypothetical protein
MKDMLVWALNHARKQTLSLAADVPPDRGCLQSAPGEQHAVWVLGHLLLGDTYLLTLLGVEQLSADFPTLLSRYGPGAAPLPSPEHYDSSPSLIQRLESSGSRRLEAIQRMTLEDLRRPNPDAILAQAQPTIGHHLHAIVCHEGYHAGQLAAWRRIHGFGPVRWAFAPPVT